MTDRNPLANNRNATAMVLLFVVCGWREEAMAGVCLRTYLVHSTYVFLYQGYDIWKNRKANCTWRNPSGCGKHNQDKPGGTRQGAASTTRINLEEPVRVASPTRINSFLRQSVNLSVCLSVRAKIGIE